MNDNFYGELSVIPMRGSEDFAEQVDNYLKDWRWHIEDETFSGCGNLGEVVLPDSVEKIGKNAFKDCVTIHTLVIPPNVAYIDNTSFDGVDQTKIDISRNECAQKVIKGALPKKMSVYLERLKIKLEQKIGL